MLRFIEYSVSIFLGGIRDLILLLAAIALILGSVTAALGYEASGWALVPVWSALKAGEHVLRDNAYLMNLVFLFASSSLGFVFSSVVRWLYQNRRFVNFLTEGIVRLHDSALGSVRIAMDYTEAQCKNVSREKKVTEIENTGGDCDKIRVQLTSAIEALGALKDEVTRDLTFLGKLGVGSNLCDLALIAFELSESLTRARRQQSVGSLLDGIDESDEQREKLENFKLSLVY